MEKKAIRDWCIFLVFYGIAIYGCYTYGYNSGYDDGYDEGYDDCISSYSTKTIVSDFNYNYELPELENFTAYKAGYKDFPNSTIYDNISQYAVSYGQTQFNCMYYNDTDNISLYCLGYTAAKEDRDRKVAQEAKDNAAQEVEQRITNM